MVNLHLMSCRHEVKYVCATWLVSNSECCQWTFNERWVNIQCTFGEHSVNGWCCSEKETWSRVANRANHRAGQHPRETGPLRPCCSMTLTHGIHSLTLHGMTQLLNVGHLRTTSFSFGGHDLFNILSMRSWLPNEREVVVGLPIFYQLSHTTILLTRYWCQVGSSGLSSGTFDLRSIGTFNESLLWNHNNYTTFVPCEEVPP